MKPYTVVLLRPDYLCDEPYGQDIYVAHVEAQEVCAAVQAAQQQVYKADRKDKLAPRSPSDYALCVLFEGTHEPKLFGWQAH